MTDTDPAPAFQAALHDRIANAIGRIAFVLPIEHRRQAADEVLAVLPPSADQAAVLDEAAADIETLLGRREAEELDQHGYLDHESELQGVAVRDVIAHLRTRANEARPHDWEQPRPSLRPRANPIPAADRAELHTAAATMRTLSGPAAEPIALLLDAIAAAADDKGAPFRAEALAAARAINSTRT